MNVVVQQKVGSWYPTVCYKIEAIENSDSGVAAGIDRNCGQDTYTTSAGGKGMIYQPKVNERRHGSIDISVGCHGSRRGPTIVSARNGGYSGRIKVLRIPARMPTIKPVVGWNLTL